jgi:uncharacterized protein (TIGR01777 family)
MRTVLITGGTGLIGTALTKLLTDKGYKVIILTRNPKNHTSSSAIQYAAWNISQQTIDASAIQQADYIIHLAGASVVDKRWTAKRKKEIVDSRTQSSALLVKALKEIPNKVKAVVSASAIGWYGADPAVPNNRPFVEADTADSSFPGETCRLWEESIEPVTTISKRLVKLRTGIVLSKDGGALAAFKKPIRFGVAGIISKGKQMISWIHIDDLCRIYLEAIENEELEGVYNAVAPKPVSNKELVLQLAKTIKGSFYIPLHIPSFILKLALGEMSIEVLKSTTVSSHKIRKTGFNFIYPSIEAAIKSSV